MKSCSLLILLMLPAAVQAQSRILVDGTFDDWDGRSALFVDASQDGAAQLDLGGLWATADDQFLILRFEVGAEILLQEENGLLMYLDTDLNASTGQPFAGIGAELVWDFGARTGTFWNGGQALAIGHFPIGIVTAPTHSASEFEVALPLNATPDGVTPLFPGASMNLVLRDRDGGDLLPGGSGGVTVSLQDEQLGEVPALPIAKERESDLRIVSYNVHRDDLFDTNLQPAFVRILQALQPDIIGFQEILQHTAEETREVVEQALPSGESQQWFTDRISPDLVVVSRFPIAQSWSIPGGNSGDANGAFLLSLGLDGPGDLLLINAHPPCCRNDQARQEDFDAMMASIRDAKTGSGSRGVSEDTPIVVLGDMNMVGAARQLETLLTGDILNNGAWGPDFAPDWDGTDLTDLRPRHTHGPMNFTWYNPESAFHPGRLDFIIYSDAVLEAARHFTLFTPSMTTSALTDLGLQSEDTTTASDHLPVVGDFRLLNTGLGAEPLPQRPELSVYPNPFSDWITVSAGGQIQRVELFDVLGRLVWKGARQGSSAVDLRGLDVPSGVYLIRVLVGDQAVERTLIRAN